MLDLVRYPRAAGGLDNIATIISDLGGRIDPGKLASLSAAFERSVIQRLGYLLESGATPTACSHCMTLCPKRRHCRG
jgi:hypothetical protein